MKMKINVQIFSSATSGANDADVDAAVALRTNKLGLNEIEFFSSVYYYFMFGSLLEFVHNNTLDFSDKSICFKQLPFSSGIFVSSCGSGCFSMSITG